MLLAGSIRLYVGNGKLLALDTYILQRNGGEEQEQEQHQLWPWHTYLPVLQSVSAYWYAMPTKWSTNPPLSNRRRLFWTVSQHNGPLSWADYEQMHCNLLLPLIYLYYM